MEFASPLPDDFDGVKHEDGICNNSDIKVVPTYQVTDFNTGATNDSLENIFNSKAKPFLKRGEGHITKMLSRNASQTKNDSTFNTLRESKSLQEMPLSKSSRIKAKLEKTLDLNTKLKVSVRSTSIDQSEGRIKSISSK